MASITLSRQEFHQNTAAAEEAAHQGPVFITEDGVPRAVLIDIAEYRKLTTADATGFEPERIGLAAKLAVPANEYFAWEPEPLGDFFECDSASCICSTP